MKVKFEKKNKNDRIDEDTSEGEDPDSMGHSEENKTDESESEELILSNKTQKEGDADDLVDTGTDTDMSETNKRDHSDECDDGESTESDTTTVNNEEAGGNVDIEDFYDVYGD